MKSTKTSPLIVFYLFLGILNCKNTGNDFVFGNEAIQKIQEEIRIISTYETVGLPSLVQNSSCNTGYGTATNPPERLDDTEPNDLYATPQTFDFNPSRNPFAEITGSIEANGDIDVFQIRTNATVGTVSIRFERNDPDQVEQTICRLSTGTDESANGSGFPSGFFSDLPPNSPQTLEVGSETFNFAYIGCEGMPGQSYRISLAEASYVEMDRAFAANLRFLNALAAPVNFTTALKLEPDAKYTRNSLDICVEEIHDSGYVLAAWNYNVQMTERCITDVNSYEYARILLLYSSCKLKHSGFENLDKIYGTDSI
ncbi:hypothetical protein EHQ12_18160 [Leptospira gomenensis]|uniref:Uncharacterized protein n=1 Tax=Leptospira gomenensis TaxID=2484974 RepID=A0A5F1Y806_9LEPT|nr:hypothetical protein [Leptospira gomenensis]TGK28975.1 hypothetical protein EHQ17_16585 [Leptospira gomenensis]TGK32798.1 hypothetical protein EHQ12_18160 [Leptospira gomenensis]TGK40734.1 hypothetical protein EHQ07_17930 [Leptospira gomenensis]TGK68422.1 hypothetical protein EHQ13_00125 [Leptospira gomenensis]